MSKEINASVVQIRKNTCLSRSEVTGSSPVGGANNKFIVSFGANVVLTAETKTGMSSEADLNVNQIGRYANWVKQAVCKTVT